MKHNANQARLIATLIRNMCEVAAMQEGCRILSMLSGIPVNKAKHTSQLDELQQTLTAMLQDFDHCECELCDQQVGPIIIGGN